VYNYIPSDWKHCSVGDVSWPNVARLWIVPNNGGDGEQNLANIV